MRCEVCKRGVYKTDLLVIDGNYYCMRCLKQLIRKATGGQGRYYTHLKNRVFISFTEEYGRLNIREFKLSELMVA